MIHALSKKTAKEYYFQFFLILSDCLILFALDGLEEDFTEATDLVTPQKSFFSWQDVADKGFISLFTFLIGKIAEKEVEVEVMLLIAFGL